MTWVAWSSQEWRLNLILQSCLDLEKYSVIFSWLSGPAEPRGLVQLIDQGNIISFLYNEVDLVCLPGTASLPGEKFYLFSMMWWSCWAPGWRALGQTACQPDKILSFLPDAVNLLSPGGVKLSGTAHPLAEKTILFPHAVCFPASCSLPWGEDSTCCGQRDGEAKDSMVKLWREQEWCGKCSWKKPILSGRVM